LSANIPPPTTSYLSSLGEIFISLTKELKITQLNDAACNLFERSREQLIHHDFPSLLADNSKHQFLYKLENLNPASYKSLVKFVFSSKEGKSICVDCWIRGEFNAEAKLESLKLFGIIRRETALYPQNPDILIQIISNTLEAIIISDTTGKIQSINHMCESVTKYTQQEIIGKSVFWFLNPDAPPEWTQSVTKSLQDNRSWQGKSINKRKNGDSFLTSVKMILIDSSDGVNGIIVSYFKEVSINDAIEKYPFELNLRHPVTHLPKRELLINRIQHAVQLAKRNIKQVAIVCVAVDNLDMYKNTYGKDGVAKILVECSQRLSRTLRMSDTIAHLDNDDFVVVIENQEPGSLDGVKTVARKISIAINVPIQLNNQSVDISSRLGVSLYPGDGSDPETLLQKSRAALEKEDHPESIRVAFYSLEYPSIPPELLDLQTIIPAALMNKEFFLEFQPIVDVSTRKISSLEALMRWQHPKIGTIFPDTFMPSIEASGFMMNASEWIIHNACQQVQSLFMTDQPEVGFSINLSLYQLTHSEIIQICKNALEHHGLSPRFMTIELSEKSLMENLEENRRLIDAFRQLGIRVAIDDFGMGVSSLKTLKSLPIQSIKIDRSFIQYVAKDLASLSLVQGLISIGKHLGVEIIAKGVESVDQVDLLISNGCHALQGYYFSRPLRLAELRGRLSLPLPWKS
jgi:diguanylate cyclase (GGDEF)-like protein/PAS domain S-box-containing protein